jgi:hypothetical protein
MTFTENSVFSATPISFLIQQAWEDAEITKTVQ